MRKIGYSRGFTLIEVLVVLAIIAILCMFALPAPNSALSRKEVAESLELIESFKKLATTQYSLTETFPADNSELGIPNAELLVGNYVTRIELEQGAFHIHFGNKVNKPLQDKILSVRPIVVEGSPESPPSWICGYSSVPNLMRALGENKTSVEQKYLPFNCLDLGHR